MAAARDAGNIFAELVLGSGICHPAIPVPVRGGSTVGDRSKTHSAHPRRGRLDTYAGAGRAVVAELVQMVAIGHRDCAGVRRGFGGHGPAELF